MKALLITVGILHVLLACVIGGLFIYNRSRAIPIVPPTEQRHQSAETLSKRIKIEVLSSDRVRIAGVEMSIAEMERRGATERWEEGDGVSIVTFGSSVYSDGIAVLDAVRRLGIEKVGFETSVGSKQAAEPGATDNPGDTQ